MFLKSIEGEMEPPSGLKVPARGYMAYGSSRICSGFAMDAVDDPKAGQFRSIVHEAVRELGHPGIVGIPGRDLLAPEYQSLDLVHPPQSGMEQIAQRLYAAISRN